MRILGLLFFFTPVSLFSASATLVLEGIDSLSVLNYPQTESQMKAVHGDGGPGYQAFNEEVANKESIAWVVSGGVPWSDLYSSPGSTETSYSFCMMGLYFLGGAGGAQSSILWPQDQSYTTARLYYLRRPGGGTCKFGFDGKAIGTFNSINTDGALSLQWSEITYTDTLSASVTQITTNTVLFGILFYKTTGVMVSSIGQTANTFANFMLYNSSFMQQWYASFPTDTMTIIVAGQNDGAGMSQATYQTNCARLITDIFAGCPTCNIMGGGWNQTDSGGTAAQNEKRDVWLTMSKYYPVGYFDSVGAVGNFSNVQAQGYRLDVGDAIHLNTTGDALVSANYRKIWGLLSGNGTLSKPVWKNRRAPGGL